jgi:hypothetical protein
VDEEHEKGPGEAAAAGAHWQSTAYHWHRVTKYAYTIKQCCHGYTQAKITCVFITAVPITKLFAGGGGGPWGKISTI